MDNVVEVPFLTPSLKAASFVATRANECYATPLAAFMGERGYVRAAFLKAEHIVLLKSLGKKPLLLFFDLSTDIVRKPLDKRMTTIDLRQIKDDAKDEPLDFGDQRIWRVTMLSTQLADFTKLKLPIVSKHEHKSLVLVDVEANSPPRFPDGLVFPFGEIVEEGLSRQKLTVKFVKDADLQSIFKTAQAITANCKASCYVSGFSVRVLLPLDIRADDINSIKALDATIHDVIADIRPKLDRSDVTSVQSDRAANKLLILTPIASKINTPSVVNAIVKAHPNLEGLKGDTSGYLFKMKDGHDIAPLLKLTFGGAFRFMNYSLRGEF